MFEVGFSELLLIMALALVVLGPEKLPKVASQVGRWMGRARAMARQFRETLDEEVQLDPTVRRPGQKTSGGSAGIAASSPPAGPAATSAAAAGGLAAGATDTDPAMAAGANVPYSDAAYSDAGQSDATGATPTDDDADTRHNDYTGSAYSPPDTSLDPLTMAPAPSPAGYDAGADAAPAPATAHDAARDAPATADDHGQRGA